MSFLSATTLIGRSGSPSSESNSAVRPNQQILGDIQGRKVTKQDGITPAPPLPLPGQKPRRIFAIFQTLLSRQINDKARSESKTPLEPQQNPPRGALELPKALFFPSDITKVAKIIPISNRLHFPKLGELGSSLRINYLKSLPANEAISHFNRDKYLCYHDTSLANRILGSIVRKRLEEESIEGFEEWLSKALSIPRDKLLGDVKSLFFLYAAIPFVLKEKGIDACLTFLKNFEPHSLRNRGLLMQCVATLIRSSVHQESMPEPILKGIAQLADIPNFDRGRYSMIGTLLNCGCCLAHVDTTLVSLSGHSELSPEIRQRITSMGNFVQTGKIKDCNETVWLPSDETGVSFIRGKVLADLYKIYGRLIQSNGTMDEQSSSKLKEIEDNPNFFALICSFLTKHDLQTAATLARHLSNKHQEDFIFYLASSLRDDYINNYTLNGSDKTPFSGFPSKHSTEDVECVATFILGFHRETFESLKDYSSWNLINFWVIRGLLRTNIKENINKAILMTSLMPELHHKPHERFDYKYQTLETVFDYLEEQGIATNNKKLLDKGKVFLEVLSGDYQTKKALQLGKAYARLRYFEESEKILDVLTDGYSKDTLLEHMGIMRCVYGLHKESLETMRKIFSNSHRNQALQGMGQLLTAMGEFDKSREAYSAMSHDYSSTQDSFYITLSQGKLEEAESFRLQLPYDQSNQAYLDFYRVAVTVHTARLEFPQAMEFAQKIRTINPSKEAGPICFDAWSPDTEEGHLKTAYTQCLNEIVQGRLDAARKFKENRDVSRELRDGAYAIILKTEQDWSTPFERFSSLRVQAFDSLIKSYLEANESAQAEEVFKNMRIIYSEAPIHLKTSLRLLSDYFNTNGDIPRTVTYLA